jgi:thiamine transporter ThiT
MWAMDLVYDLLVALHLLGMAAVVGGWIAVRSGRTVIAPIVWGARAQLVTGLVLVGIASAIKDDEHTVDNTKIAVKLVIALVVLAAAEIGSARGRKGQDTGSLLDVAGGGAVANVLVATLW